MKNRMKAFVILLLVFRAVSHDPVLPLFAAESETGSLTTGQISFDTIEKVLNKSEVTIDELSGSMKKLKDIETEAERCIENGNVERGKVIKAIDLIGPETDNEPAEVISQRRNLQQRKVSIEKKLAECQLALVRSSDMESQLTVRREQLATREFFHKQDDIGRLIEDGIEHPDAWLSQLYTFIVGRSGLAAFSEFSIVLGLILAGLAMALGFWARRLILDAAASKGKIVRQAMDGLVHHLPGIALTSVAGIFTILVTRDIPYPSYVTVLLLAASIYLLLSALIRYFFTSPFLGQENIPESGEDKSWGRYQLRFASFLLAFCITFLVAGIGRDPEFPVIIFLRILAVTALCLSLIRLIWLIRNFAAMKKYAVPARLIFTPLFLTIIVVEWLGYHNVAEYLLFNLLKTIAGLLIFYLARNVSAAVLKGLSYGEEKWAQAIRQHLGLNKNEVGACFLWMYFLLNTLWLTLFLLFVLYIWSVSEKLYNALVAVLVGGFSVGDLTVVPLRVYIGAVLFVLLWIASLWGKSVMKASLAGDTHFTKSARDAAVTVSGYLGFIVALLIGLAMAGMNFTSLTVIAGALSVGIGFGMQNIVNNFVSGLILLFERPVRRGDWIVVGETEGYVKKISVRSTVISTFDRADVIVPNSELISSQVINWMLSDRRGRLRIPVGVAYGSDTELVRRLLLEVAENHPEVVKDEVPLKPLVLFIGFGNSSLDFELRCFIREVDHRFIVTSDLNFAIDRAFRQNRVQIPFPQRDVHIIPNPDQSG